MRSGENTECALLKELARSHGWSETVSVDQLAADANVDDEQQARDAIRDTLPSRPYVVYHPGRDKVYITGPPMNDLAEDLRDCGWAPIQIEATLGDYQDIY